MIETIKENIKEVFKGDFKCYPVDSSKIGIEVYEKTCCLGISDGQFDIFNKIEENFEIIDWNYCQNKEHSSLQILIKKPERLLRCTNYTGEILYIDNKTGEEYYGKQGMDNLLQIINKELSE